MSEKAYKLPNKKMKIARRFFPASVSILNRSAGTFTNNVALKETSNSNISPFSIIPSSTPVTKAEPKKPPVKRRKDSKASVEVKKGPMIDVNELPDTLMIYSDGSCIANGQKNAFAGWGFVVVKFRADQIENLKISQGKNIISENNKIYLNDLLNDINIYSCDTVSEQYGPVKIEGDEFSLGAEVHTNNTAELSAIGEGLLFIKNQYKDTLPKQIIVLYDSDYAAKSVMGLFKGEKNKELIQTIRGIFQSLNDEMKLFHKNMNCGINFAFVRGHSNDFFNDKADGLAFLGATGFWTSQGRYSHIPPNQSP